jgi:tetrahydromethanopterin S-methyltransferase subunit C
VDAVLVSPLRRAQIVVATVAIVAGVVGAAVARTSRRGVVVGISELDLNLYTVNLAGSMLLLGIGVVAFTSVLSDTPVPMLVAAGLSAALALYGLLAWRNDTRNPLGFDGRTITLLVGLAASFAALGWVASRPKRPAG